MFWINIGSETHQITSFNLYENHGTFQLWVERPNGKTMLVAESKDEEYVRNIKVKMDNAIESDKRLLTLD
ncbi:hypothetical protein [Rossellomorea aquimaris]|uniref:Uncharacterized protein n=1 Tax=Rossellomorea aquimaris TaxID=189382 RepID=A0A366EFP4_9BACI|nr:hypothetical protein [Rossellomorea aquimaris]RBP01212.1 hypothetical protein DET59_12013 [Rossellomorea aquimaris]